MGAALLQADTISLILSQLCYNYRDPLDEGLITVGDRIFQEGMKFLCAYTSPWTRIRCTSERLTWGNRESWMSFHLRYFTLRAAQQGQVQGNGFMVHRESGFFLHSDAASDKNMDAQAIHEMRASVVVRATTKERPAIWDIVIMVDEIGSLQQGTFQDILIPNYHLQLGPFTGIFVFIRCINYLLGGSEGKLRGWQGVLAAWEEIVQALDDQLKIPVCVEP